MAKLYGENLRPYKDIKLVKFCKVCKIDFKPRRYSHQAALGLCIKHRREYYRRQSIYIKKWLAGKSAEVQKKYKEMYYANWLRWIKRHPEKRRKMAIDSYHRRKNEPKNKIRKHRAALN